MMKKVLFKTMMGAGLAGALLAGCADDIKDAYDPDYVLELYKANWEAQFGEIDSEQTWNTAKQVTAYVEVGYSGDYTLKIYTANPKSANAEAYLMAQYPVKGGELSMLEFDMPSALHYVYAALVDANGGAIVKSAQVKDGEVELFFGVPTRAINVSTTGDVKVSEGDYMVYNQADCQIFLETVPEDPYYTTTPNRSNKDYVYPNFQYKSTGKFVIYPMYRVTDNYSMELGVYYYDASGQMQEQLLFSIAGAIEQKNKHTEYVWNQETMQNDEIVSYSWSAADYNTNYALQYSTDGELRSKGVVVDIPVGTAFGFYLTTGYSDAPKVYSEKSLNGENGCFGASFYNDGNMYLAFEDYVSQAEEQRDFNDLVCLIQGITDDDTPEEETPVTPEIIDKDPIADTPQSWIVACEDLGSTDDFDFNDIVFSVSYVNGATTAEVTPLAAGGTLAANIILNGTNLGEIHAWLGGKAGSMINTGAGATGAGASKTVTVDAGFAMSDNMGGFSIQVIKEDGTTTVDVTAPGQGTAPQMICVPGGWAWPTERSNISVAYPQFGAWGSNYNSAVEWYNAPAEGYVCK